MKAVRIVHTISPVLPTLAAIVGAEDKSKSADDEANKLVLKMNIEEWLVCTLLDETLCLCQLLLLYGICSCAAIGSRLCRSKHELGSGFSIQLPRPGLAAVGTAA
jgi:hypothetical protein